MCQEVSRGHSSYRQRAAIDKWKSHRSNEGLNVKMFQIKQGGSYQPCYRRNRVKEINKQDD
jgi:hypothetical protein